MRPGEVHVWRIPTGDKPAAHTALRAILAAFTGEPLEFARTASGKPYLPATPELRFNLSHGRGMALVGVALDVEVGVDVERVRPVPQHMAIAERFFPPAEAADFSAFPETGREREFFRRWTRLESVLKANGIGLYGAGQQLGGEWTIQEIDAGQEFAAAVAAAATRMRIVTHDYLVGQPMSPEFLGAR